MPKANRAIVSGVRLVFFPTATQNLLLAAESLGLGSCWIFFVLLAFFSERGAELRKELRIPEGYKPYTWRLDTKPGRPATRRKESGIAQLS